MSTVERFIREVDANQPCNCASRKCGPHRCLPSLFGWVCVGGLLVYAIVMHSFFSAERAEMRGALAETISQKVDQQLQTVQQIANAIPDKVDQQLQAFQQTLDDEHHVWNTELIELEAQARRVRWGIATPDVERDMQLQQQIDAMQKENAATAP